MTDGSAEGGRPSAGGPLVVEPGAVSATGAAQSDAAATVSAQAVAERIDTGALVPTFGVIGAPFLAALNRVGVARTTELEELASRHRATARRVEQARTGYDCCDSQGAARMRGVPA